jgi:UDP-N-acetylmuramoylalanine--D-glutamate ligase
MRAKKLDAAVYLNLSPNHLDRHASMEEYAAAKANIQHCLKPGGKLFCSPQVAHFFPQAVIFNAVFEQPCPFLAQQNVCAARALVTFFGVSEEQFLSSLPMFEKPPHRIEWVAESEGIRYYNDSKATSVEAVLHALSFFSGPLVLIVGGLDKGSPYLPWIQAFRGKVKKIVAYGEASAKIQQEMAAFYPLQRVTTLTNAVIAANKSAEAGDTVLLCPGCSSYDQFENYEHRGNEFKKLVRETIGVRS